MAIQNLSFVGLGATLLSAQNITNTTSNSTSEPLASNIYHGTSIANSGIFIISFIVLLVVVVVFYKRSKSMLFNQQMLFFLVSFFIFIQLANLIFRTVYNSIGIYVNSLGVDEDTLFKEYYSTYVAMSVFGVLEFSLALSQMITILVIMCFIINVFLKTVYLVGGLSKKVYYGLVITSNILTGFFAAIFLVMVFALVIIQLLVRLKVITFDQFSLYLACFLVYLFVMLFQTCVLIGTSIRVLRIIKERSVRTTQMGATSRLAGVVQRPFTKIVGLLVGIVLSCFLQILAGVVSVFTSFWENDLHFLDYFLEAFSVLVIAIIVLLLYNPLLNEAYEARPSANISAVEMKEEIKLKQEAYTDVSSPSTPQVTSPETSETVSV